MGEYTIIPAESNLGLDELIEKANKLGVQIFDANVIAGEEHIKFAIFHAKKAFEEKKNIAKNQNIEILLRAAATRQISVAIEKVGVKDPKNIILAFPSEREDILKELNAKQKEWEINREKVIEAFNLDPGRDINEQIIEKIVSVQLYE